MGLHIALSDSDSDDINGMDLSSELSVLREITPKGTDTALQALRYLNSLHSSCLNTEIACRIMLTGPGTVASEERSFSKLKIIESCGS
jgi:hypothetical protein